MEEDTGEQLLRVCGAGLTATVRTGGHRPISAGAAAVLLQMLRAAQAAPTETAGPYQPELAA